MAALTIKKLRLGVVVFYFVLFAGLALYDERPDPNMIAEMMRPLPAVTGTDNAYIVFLGFDAPAGNDPYEWGQKKLREVDKAFATRTNINAYLSSSLDSFINSKEKLVFKGERPTFYDKKEKGIINYISAHPSEAAELARENKELLQRYKSLFSYKAYHEPLDYSYYMPIPLMSPVRNAQTLYLFDLANMARSGSLIEALTGLQKDIEFWRLIARNSTTLISKLISMSIINTDIRFAGELGTVRALNAKEMLLIRNVLRPLDAGEATLAGAFSGESRYMYKGAGLSMYQNARPMDRLFYKRNATDNRMHANMQEMIRLAELPSEKFAIQVKTRESEKDISYKAQIPFLYNPAGEILAVIGQSQGYVWYIERGHNLDGLRRLALLKVLAKKENVRPEHMQQFLDAQAAEFKDPYTSGPMKWDTKKECIYFNFATGDKRIEMFL